MLKALIKLLKGFIDDYRQAKSKRYTSYTYDTPKTYGTKIKRR